MSDVHDKAPIDLVHPSSGLVADADRNLQALADFLPIPESNWRACDPQNFVNRTGPERKLLFWNAADVFQKACERAEVLAGGVAVGLSLRFRGTRPPDFAPDGPAKGPGDSSTSPTPKGPTKADPPQLARRPTKSEQEEFVKAMEHAEWTAARAASRARDPQLGPEARGVAEMSESELLKRTLWEHKRPILPGEATKPIGEVLNSDTKEKASMMELALKSMWKRGVEVEGMQISETGHTVHFDSITIRGNTLNDRVWFTRELADWLNDVVEAWTFGRIVGRPSEQGPMRRFGD